MHRSAASPGLVRGGDVCEEFGAAFSYCGGTVGGVWKKPVVADDGGGSGGGGDMFLTRLARYMGASVNFLLPFLAVDTLRVRAVRDSVMLHCIQL